MVANYQNIKCSTIIENSVVGDGNSISNCITASQQNIVTDGDVIGATINLSDFEIKIPDKLELVFKKQQELAGYFAEKQPDSYYHHGPHRFPHEKLMMNMLAIEDEFSELRKVIPWKWWKTRDPQSGYYKEDSMEDPDSDGFLTPEDRATQQQLHANSRQEYIEKELIDVGHFYIQMLIDAGITPQRFVELYLEKNQENKRRQDNGY